MRALIDASGWPEALSHYRMFPYEPSVTRDLDCHIEQIVPLEGINLEKVLDEMNKAGDDDEAEILIVSHGTVAEDSTGGLTMPLATGCGVDAMRDEVRAVTEAAIAVQESASHPLGWARFIEDPQVRRQVQTSATPEQGPGLLQQWLQARADSLKMSKERLLELTAKRNEVTGHRFQRVEIRACNLGAFQEAMEALLEFFGASRLLAPRVTMLCGRLRAHILEDPNQYQDWIHSQGALGTGTSFEEMEGASGRTFGKRSASESRRVPLSPTPLSWRPPRSAGRRSSHGSRIASCTAPGTPAMGRCRSRPCGPSASQGFPSRTFCPANRNTEA